MIRHVAAKQKKPNYWIFQANPKMYDLLDRLNSGSPDPFWSANQHREEMSIGDKIYFRISGTKKGLYATGTIKSLPEASSDEFGDWRVKVRFDGLLDPPIFRTETEKISELRNFRPLVGAEATNFKVPVAIARKIEKLIFSDHRVVRKIQKGVEILPPLGKITYKPEVKPISKKGTRSKPSQEQIRKVEQAAVTIAMKYFFKEGLSMIEDCQQKGVGYDFVFGNARKRLHVEVKGVSGSKIDFNLTPKELKCAKNDGKWKLLVVTDALLAPKVKLLSGKELLAKAKAIEPTQYRVTF